MSRTYENLSFTDNMPLDLLRELIHDGIVPESCDPAYASQADVEAFHADLRAMPLDLPTMEEIEQMARDQGIPVLPF